MVLEPEWRTTKKKMATPEISVRSPRLSEKSRLSFPSSSPGVLDPSTTAAYERYLHLPALGKLCGANDFPEWSNEPIVRPALQALEITFRFISIALSDPRPYANHREWKRRLQSLATHQIEIIADICEEDGPTGGAPVANLSSSEGVLARRISSHEVWKLPGAAPVVSRTSQGSLLPRLAAWEKSEDSASKIMFQIECQMQRCPFTLGLGEPNLAGKPYLEYDLIVRPSDLHALKQSPSESKSLNNHENQTLFTIHQILESWIFAARELLKRITERIEAKEWVKASSDCWILERIWMLLSKVEELHLLTDPDDLLRLKSQLAIKATPGSEAFCFRSTALLDLTRTSKDLKRRVPWILGAEVDPNGGPRVQEAAMKLFHSHNDNGRIHLLQALQAVEGATKKFFFGYRQLIVAAMGSLEASGNHASGLAAEPSDSLSQLFFEPPYFPSVDAAKTFLGEFWHKEATGSDKTFHKPRW